MPPGAPAQVRKRLTPAGAQGAKEERELYMQYRTLARFWTNYHHEEYMRSLSLESRIRRRIEQLQDYRRLGMTTFKESDEWEAERRRREADDKLKKHGRPDTSSYLMPKAGTTQRMERRDRPRGDDPPPDAVQADTSATAAAEATGAGAVGLKDGGLAGKKGAAAAAAAVMEAYKSMSGANMLGKAEMALCQAQRLPPPEYLPLKLALMTESCRMGYLTPQAAKRVYAAQGLDPAKALQVYNLMVTSGWVRTADRGPGLA